MVEPPHILVQVLAADRVMDSPHPGAFTCDQTPRWSASTRPRSPPGAPTGPARFPLHDGFEEGPVDVLALDVTALVVAELGGEKLRSPCAGEGQCLVGADHEPSDVAVREAVPLGLNEPATTRAGTSSSAAASAQRPMASRWCRSTGPSRSSISCQAVPAVPSSCRGNAANDGSDWNGKSTGRDRYRFRILQLQRSRVVRAGSRSSSSAPIPESRYSSGLGQEGPHGPMRPPPVRLALSAHGST